MGFLFSLVLLLLSPFDILKIKTSQKREGIAKKEVC